MPGLMLDKRTHSTQQVRRPHADFWLRVRRENRSRDLHNMVQEILNLGHEIVDLADGLGRPRDRELTSKQIGAQVTEASGEISRIARNLEYLLNEGGQ
jgi:hypothetical protein